MRSVTSSWTWRTAAASIFQRLAHALREHGRIVVYLERHRPLESLGTGNQHPEPPRKGSAAIHASCGPEACLPPATTAASMRSRRWPGMPLMSKTVSGMNHQL